jgi:acyl dehydratase
VRFGELSAGRVITSGPRTVTAEEMVEFARRYDPQWYHADPARARDSRWGGLIASGWLTCAVAMQLAVAAVLGDSESIGSPGVEQLRWPNPLRPGDTVSLRMEVLESRRSRNGSTGIVRWRWQLHNQRGEALLDLLATSLFEMR